MFVLKKKKISGKKILTHPVYILLYIPTVIRYQFNTGNNARNKIEKDRIIIKEKIIKENNKKKLHFPSFFWQKESNERKNAEFQVKLLNQSKILIISFFALVRLVLKTGVERVYTRFAFAERNTITGSSAGTSLIARFIALSRSDLFPNNVQLTLKLSWNIIFAGGSALLFRRQMLLLFQIMQSRQTNVVSPPYSCGKINCRSEQRPYYCSSSNVAWFMVAREIYQTAR